MQNHNKPVRPFGPAPRRVGVRELKAQATRILREVRETRMPCIVTHRGEAVGAIVPWKEGETEAWLSPDAAWREFVASGEEVAKRIQRGKSLSRILSASRR